MIKVAIVDDLKNDADWLIECINRYAVESKTEFRITEFINGEEFLQSNNTSYDIIFMDVKMPFLNGVKTAQKLRKINDVSCLVFVTRMASYAIYGYEVNASDYILKPVDYDLFSYKMNKILKIVEKKKRDSVTVKVKGGVFVLEANDIIYLELLDHKVVYHTSNGALESWDTLANAFKTLEDYGFAYCNSGYIVNLKYIVSVKKNEVELKGNILLPISRGKRDQFMEKFTLAMGSDI